jgi:hypothetical protein
MTKPHSGAIPGALAQTTCEPSPSAWRNSSTVTPAIFCRKLTAAAVLVIVPVHMGSHTKLIRNLLITFAALAPVVAIAQDAPLQVDVQVRAKPTGFGASFHRELDGGGATVFGRVQNLPGNQTALVTLQFDYKTRADIALDEIIDRIVISIEDLGGNVFSTATIDPNTVPLNPNRVPLYYSATLYTPDAGPKGSGYVVHVQVFGNYE